MEMVCRNGRMAGVNCRARPLSQGAGVGRGVGGTDKAGRGGRLSRRLTLTVVEAMFARDWAGGNRRSC